MTENMMQSKEVQMDWIATIIRAHPMTQTHYLGTIWSTIVIRSHKLAGMYGLDFQNLVAFMMEWTRDECIGGVKPENIVGMLPKNLADIGYAKIKHDSNAISKYKKGLN